jgi:hypothetical protein
LQFSVFKNKYKCIFTKLFTIEDSWLRYTENHNIELEHFTQLRQNNSDLYTFLKRFAWLDIIYQEEWWWGKGVIIGIGG